jgi:hypothetical protein
MSVDSHLITKSTHPGTLGLLYNVKPAGLVSMISSVAGDVAERRYADIMQN